MTTQDKESGERGWQPLLRPDDPPATEARDAQPEEARAYRKPLEVPVVYATIDPLDWQDEEQVLKALRCVTVEANIAVAETVSVSLTSCDPDGYPGMVFFDLTPTDAAALADELRRAAEDAVYCSRCGRTLATMGDSSDICPIPEQVAT